MSMIETYANVCKTLDDLTKENTSLAFDRAILINALESKKIEICKNESDLLELKKEAEFLKDAVVGCEENQTPTSRQLVLAQIKNLPNEWIKPFGIAVLTGVPAEEVCAILRGASKVKGMTIEHNNERGQASMYRWAKE